MRICSSPLQNREMKPHLIDPKLFDRLEGLNSRYALLTRRVEALRDAAAAFDQPPDPELANFEALQRKIKAEVVRLLESVLRELK